jgi:Zn-dependent M28 family amino/carboxypeptidase
MNIAALFILMERTPVIRSALLLLAATSLTAAPAAAQQISPQRLSDHTRILGSDAYEGRGVATRAETKTVNYIIAQLRAAGVQPGGAVVNGKRTWTQPVPLLKSDLAGDPIVTVTGKSGNARLVQGTDIALRSPTNGAKQIRLTNVPIVFAGYGVTAPERGWDDFKNVDVRGKIIMVLINDPDFEGGEGQFGGKAMTYYGRWTYKYEEAARRGAAGVMIVHETAPASYGWNTVKNSNTNTMFDIVRDNPAASHPAMESWITGETARKLLAESGQSLDALKTAARRKDFQPVQLPATLSVTANANTQVITSQNVVGLLPGKRRPDETIVYSAHWDHLGIGLPDANGDNIYNGALDNASGIAQLIEQARAFARGPRPDRSVVFLAVTAEEKGLLGSEYYARNPLYPLSKTVAVLNTDGGALYGRSRDFSTSGSAKQELQDLLVEEGVKQGRRYSPDSKPEAGYFYRSDHFSMAKVGVPAISYEPGDDLLNGGTERGRALAEDYTAKRYHQPDDEFDPSWDFSGMAEDTQLLHNLGLRLANSTAWPNWSTDSEFRAARDATAAERGGEVPAPSAAPAAEPAPAATPGERG